MADALQNTEWTIFEKIGFLGEPYKGRADAIAGQMTKALSHDEHVLSLTSTLRRAQSEAVSLLAEAAIKPRPPSPEPPPKPPEPHRKLAKQGQKTVKSTEVIQVLAEIESDLSEETNAMVEINWKVYRQE